MENKNNKGIVISLSVVIVVLIAVIIYMLFNGNFITMNQTVKENTKEETISNNKEQNDINSSDEFVKISVSDPIVISAMNLILKSNVNKRAMSSCLFQDRLWNLNSASVDTLDDDSILELIWNNVPENDKKTLDNGNSYTIDEEVFRSVAEKVFGKKYQIPKKTTIAINCTYIMEYDSTNKSYVFETTGMGDSLALSVINYYESAEKNNDTLIIIEKVGFYIEGNLYSKPFGSEVINGNVTKDNVMNYKDDFATYKYTFKLGDNDQYYFDSMEKIN